MKNVYLINHHRGLCDDAVCVCEDYNDAVELANDLVFEAQYECFLYILSQESPHRFCGEEKNRKTMTEIEVALKHSAYTVNDDYRIIGIPFIGR